MKDEDRSAIYLWEIQQWWISYRRQAVSNSPIVNLKALAAVIPQELSHEALT